VYSDLTLNGKYPIIENGDVIVCGFKFVSEDKSIDDIVVYFTRNNNTMCEINAKFSEVVLYPTIVTGSKGLKIAPKVYNHDK
jgi:hypothetical protein